MAAKTSSGIGWRVKLRTLRRLRIVASGALSANAGGMRGRAVRMRARPRTKPSAVSLRSMPCSSNGM